MHVCFLFHRKFPQNNSTAMNEYSRKLAANGIDVSVVCAREEADRPLRETVDGVDVYRIPSDTSSSVGLEPTRFAYKGLKEVQRLCEDGTVDVLHMIAFPNLGLVLDSVPWLDAPPTTVADIRGTAISNAAFEYVSRLIINVQDRLVDHTIALHEDVAEKVLSNPETATIVPLGASFDRFEPGTNPELRASWGVDDDDVVFGYTGNVHRSRRLTRLVDAFEGLEEPYRSRAKLVIVGDGPDFGALESYVEEADTDAVTLTGGVPFDDMPAYLKAFDIGLAYIPDRPQYRDQPPLKTVEFLASGLPVIGTDTPGNKTFLQDGENARLVPDSVPAYRSAVESVLDERAVFARFGRNARDSVREYSYETIVSDVLVPLYRQLIDGPHSNH